MRASELGVATTLLPLLWFGFHVVKSVGNILAGRLVDRVGTRLPLVLGWLIYAAIYVAFALATSAWQVWMFFTFYGVYYALTEPAEKTFVEGRQRIGFLKSSVDRFVTQNPARVQRGANFSQLTDDERTEMVEHARLLADAGQPRQAVVKQLAWSMNRSVETVRSTIKRFDHEHPESPLFGGPENTLTDDLRNRIYRQYCCGASIATLAKTHRRPAAQVQRIINQTRTERILELPLEYVASDEFSNEDAETTLLGPMPQPEYTPRRARAPSGLPPYSASLYQFPLLTKEQEVYLFRKYNFAKYRASQLRERLDPKRPNAKLLDETTGQVQMPRGLTLHSRMWPSSTRIHESKTLRLSRMATSDRTIIATAATRQKVIMKGGIIQHTGSSPCDHCNRDVTRQRGATLPRAYRRSTIVYRAFH